MTRTVAPKAVIIVRRRWHQPEILAYVNQHEVGAKMQLQDFVRAVTEEVYGKRNRYALLSKAEFLDKTLAACDSILAEMKETTANVV